MLGDWNETTVTVTGMVRVSGGKVNVGAVSVSVRACSMLIIVVRCRDVSMIVVG